MSISHSLPRARPWSALQNLVAAAALFLALFSGGARLAGAQEREADFAQEREADFAQEREADFAQEREADFVQEHEADFETQHQALRAAYLANLANFAAWCSEQSLFLERDRVLRAVLELDPENAVARKGLRFTKSGDGKWVEPAPREAKNRNPKALEELPKQRQKAVESYRLAMVALMNKAGSDAATRHGVYREILVGDPDDTFVRAISGEVKDGENWVLQETANAKKRRAEIKALANKALAEVGPTRPTDKTDMESSLGVTFTVRIMTDDVRVLGTGLPDECERAAKYASAAGPFLRGLFGFATKHQPDYTIYLLANEHEETLFLANLPGLNPSFRDFLTAVVGTIVPGQPRVVYWDRDVEHRVDGASRQTVNDFLGRTYGITMNEGWAWEGFGLYLNRELCGSRLTWFIQVANGGKHNQLRKRLMMGDTNWMNEALTLLGTTDHPKFASMLDNDVNKLGLEEMLYAYAFTAYLIEGRPASEVTELLTRIGSKKESSSDAVQRVLHLDLAGVEERVYRWLSERR
jgi:hypothetical protein